MNRRDFISGLIGFLASLPIVGNLFPAAPDNIPPGIELRYDPTLEVERFDIDCRNTMEQVNRWFDEHAEFDCLKFLLSEAEKEIYLGGTGIIKREQL
jgi:hypothetical protein